MTYISNVKLILKDIIPKLENEYNRLGYKSNQLTFNEYLMQLYITYLYNQGKVFADVIKILPRDWHYVALTMLEHQVKLRGKPDVCWKQAREALVEAELYNRAERQEYLDYLSYCPIKGFKYLRK